MKTNYYSIDYNKNKYNEKDQNEYIAVFIKNGEKVMEALKPYKGKVADEILIPIGCIIGSASRLWLNRELGDIPRYTPLELLKTKDGTKALKAIIMRLYC